MNPKFFGHAYRKSRKSSFCSVESGKMSYRISFKKEFCNKGIIDIDEVPVNDHRAIELVGRLIQTIKNRLACIKEEKLTTNFFHIKHALTTILH